MDKDKFVGNLVADFIFESVHHWAHSCNMAAYKISHQPDIMMFSKSIYIKDIGLYIPENTPFRSGADDTITLI